MNSIRNCPVPVTQIRTAAERCERIESDSSVCEDTGEGKIVVSFQPIPRTVGRVAQIVSTCGTRIRGSLHQSIAKASPGFFARGASNLATHYDEQIRVPDTLKNMGYPAAHKRYAA